MSEQEKLSESWESAMQDSRVHFEVGVSKTVLMRDWSLEKEEFVDAAFGTIERNGLKYSQKWRLKAKIVEEDGKPVEKELSFFTGISKRFLQSVGVFLKDADPKVGVTLRVKRVGVGAGTNYNIESI